MYGPCVVPQPVVRDDYGIEKSSCVAHKGFDDVLMVLDHADAGGTSGELAPPAPSALSLPGPKAYMKMPASPP
jgi:hypothetical protein